MSTLNGYQALLVCSYSPLEHCRGWLICSPIDTDIAADARPELFIRKLHQCSVLFDFNDASAELKGKQIKAQALHEMLDYVTTQRGVITENIYPEVINMVGPLR